MDKVDLDRLRERRGYGLGERAPDTLPQGKCWDSPEQDASAAKKWRDARHYAEANTGGKYWH